MQNDVMLPGAPLLVDGAAAIVPNVIKSVELARERGMLVVWVFYFVFFLPNINFDLFAIVRTNCNLGKIQSKGISKFRIVISYMINFIGVNRW